MNSRRNRRIHTSRHSPPTIITLRISCIQRASHNTSERSKHNISTKEHHPYSNIHQLIIINCKMCNSNKPTRSRTRHQQIADHPSQELQGAEEDGSVPVILEAGLNDASTADSRSGDALVQSMTTRTPPPVAPSKRRRRPLRRYRPSANNLKSGSRSDVVYVNHDNESAFERKRRMHQTQHFTNVAVELLQLLVVDNFENSE